MGGKQHGIVERLWRLDSAQVRALECANHPSVAVNLLDGVAHLQAGDGGAGAAGGDGARDQRIGGERTRSVVHEHDRGAVRFQRFEAGADGTLARRCAECRFQQVETGGGLAIQVHVIAVDDRLDQVDLGVPQEKRQRLPQHRCPAEDSVLLR